MNRLDELIPQYAQNKSELDSYKKICDKENAQIKELMKDGDHEYETGGYRAVYSVSKRESFNEDILLSLFTSVPGFVNVCEKYGVVKSKLYVDFDALEKVLYDEKFTEDQIMELSKAKESKEVVTLRITKIKKKEKQ